MDYYKPYVYKGKTLRLDKYLILGMEKPEYELCNMDSLENNIKYSQFVEEIDFNIDLWNRVDEEEYNQFPLFVDTKGKLLYLYTEVFTLERQQVALKLACNTFVKVWVNEKCVCLHNADTLQQEETVILLEQGENRIVLGNYETTINDRFWVELQGK